MKIIKPGRHRLFENDRETAATVCEMLLHLERNGMNAVREYSRKFDAWDPPSFELSAAQIDEAIAQLSEQAIADTDYRRLPADIYSRSPSPKKSPSGVSTPGVIRACPCLPPSREMYRNHCVGPSRDRSLYLRRIDVESVCVDIAKDRYRSQQQRSRRRRDVKQLVSELARDIGVAIANVVNLFNPAVVVFDKRLEPCGALLLDQIARVVRNQTLATFSSELALRFGRIGEEAGVLGICLCVLEKRYEIPALRPPTFMVADALGEPLTVSSAPAIHEASV
jgi:hypothetical protein